MEFSRLGSSGPSVSKLIPDITYGKYASKQCVMEDEDEVVAFLKLAYDYGFRLMLQMLILTGMPRFFWVDSGRSTPRSTVVIMSKVFNKVRDERIENANYDDHYYWENSC